MILGLETSCDETAAALVTEEGNVALVGDLLAGRAARSLRRRRSRGRLPASPRARPPGRSGGARRGRADARRRRPGCRHAGAGPRRRAARGPLGCEGDRVGAVAAARPGRPSRRPRRLALPGRRSARAAVSVPARERRPHAAPRSARAGALGAPRDDARRCSRGSLRQGSSTARPRLPGRRGAGPACAGRRSGRICLSRGFRPGSRLLVLGAQDRSPVHGPRARGRRGRAPEARSRSLVSTRDRSSARGACACRRGGDRDSSASPSSAESRRTPRFVPRCRRRASRPWTSARTTRR